MTHPLSDLSRATFELGKHPASTESLQPCSGFPTQRRKRAAGRQLRSTCGVLDPSSRDSGSTIFEGAHQTWVRSRPALLILTSSFDGVPSLVESRENDFPYTRVGLTFT